MRGGDRFSAILAMLQRTPETVLDPNAPVVAVVGSAALVHLEAHRIAVDLPNAHTPRAVVTVPTRHGAIRREAVADTARKHPVVVAIETRDHADAVAVRRAVRAVKADIVVVVVEAGRKLEDNIRWLEDLERVDAIVLDGALDVPDPAAVLGLEWPVIRLDGVAVDRVGWAAFLCAQLVARDLAADRAGGLAQR
jgi:hypothetical protein